ncbi:MAG: hypothetical protein CM15mP129_01140 [Chloroflexota bacterium]|nr:MAG: hypothetical protein CM15mP129_01140 [Chloroflexota bacterium]
MIVAIMDQGHVFSHTFTLVGSTTFTCSPHASMYGVVNVTDPLSVDEYNIIQLDVYPNPAIDIVNIKLNTLMKMLTWRFIIC